MSLALVADYSSSEEEEEEEEEDKKKFVDSDEDSEHESDVSPTYEVKSMNLLKQPRASLLPSPDDVFLKVTGPPEFLKSKAAEPLPSRPRDTWHSAPDTSRSDGLQAVEEPLRTLINGALRCAVIQAKAVLVDDPRVMNDAGDGATDGKDSGRRVPGVNMPPPEDAAALLRICLKCSTPKTYSGAKEGMVCPLCGDRPTVDEKKATPGEVEKRSGSKIKDKERSKRMKGQSSHATWKSETEMQLRQQFD